MPPNIMIKSGLIYSAHPNVISKPMYDVNVVATWKVVCDSDTGPSIAGEIKLLHDTGVLGITIRPEEEIYIAINLIVTTCRSSLPTSHLWYFTPFILLDVVHLT